MLVTGGINGPSNNITLNSAELFDPLSGTWTATGNMTAARTGKLINKWTSVSYWWNKWRHLNSAELFDPLSGTWTATET